MWIKRIWKLALLQNSVRAMGPVVLTAYGGKMSFVRDPITFGTIVDDVKPLVFNGHSDLHIGYHDGCMGTPYKN